MSEPKKYTAKEAMHWMLDHPEKVMRYVSSASGNIGHIYFLSHRFIGDSGVNIEYFHRAEGDFYILSEYDAWQGEIEAEKERNEAMRNQTPEERDKLERLYDLSNNDSEPREGESLWDYSSRDFASSKSKWRAADTQQRWIEAYVKREIEKAVDATMERTRIQAQEEIANTLEFQAEMKRVIDRK